MLYNLQYLPHEHLQPCLLFRKSERVERHLFLLHFIDCNLGDKVKRRGNDVRGLAVTNLYK